MSSLSSLRTSLRRAISEEDSNNSNFTNTELDSYLNQATLFLGVEMEWPLQTSTAVGVLDQALYSLPDDFVSLVDAYYDDEHLTVLERADLTALNSSWQDATSGTPGSIYKADNAVIGLYPPPDSANAGLTLQIQYIQVPATLSADADIPDLHVAFQMCLPFYAAFLCESKVGNDKKAALQYQRFDLHRKSLMSKIQRFSPDSYRFRWI